MGLWLWVGSNPKKFPFYFQLDWRKGCLSYHIDILNVIALLFCVPTTLPGACGRLWANSHEHLTINGSTHSEDAEEFERLDRRVEEPAPESSAKE